MNNRKFDPRQQFSKWLARWTSIFWFFYMIYIATILIFQPDVADAVVYLSVIVSFVMTINVYAYTRNSVYEKAIKAGAEIGKIKFTWKKKAEEKSDDDDDEEGSEG